MGLYIKDIGRSQKLAEIANIYSVKTSNKGEVGVEMVK